MPNPTPTPTPALGVLPEAWRNDTEVMLRVGRAWRNDAERAEADLPPIHPDHAFRFTGVEIEELCAAVARAAITAALSQGAADTARMAGRERDAAFDVARVAHWLLNDSGYTKRHAARALADIARGLHRETAEQALGDARIALSTAQTGEASHG